MADERKKTQVVLITGPSGAGRTTAIRALEDSGYEAIDNMPLTLIPRLIDGPTLDKPLVLGVDTRNRDFSIDQLVETLKELGKHSEIRLQLAYLKCSVNSLLRRFSETRRKHHMAPQESTLIGVKRDLDLMEPVKDLADVVIETTNLSPHQLRTEMKKWFVADATSTMAISVQSFSYKKGLPRSVDMVFDCRFLRNPYWDSNLRQKDGRDIDVQAYVQQDRRFLAFRAQVRSLLELVIPAHIEEGRSHLTIAFGCTGGHHRSVTLAETLQKELLDNGWHVTIRHRELGAENPHNAPTIERVAV